MKKRLSTMLLSALLVANISACGYGYNDLSTDMAESDGNTNTDNSIFFSQKYRKVLGRWNHEVA